VEWKGESTASVTWEDVGPFYAKYPAFELEDELVLEGERDVMIGPPDPWHAPWSGTIEKMLLIKKMLPIRKMLLIRNRLLIEKMWLISGC
jgi:hypothetical protein